MNKDIEAIRYFKECILKDTIFEEGLTLSFMKEANEYIEQLETKVKELGKGQQELMQSRRKWKCRYYNLKNRNKKLKDKLIADKIEQFDDYVIYLLESYLDIIK